MFCPYDGSDTRVTNSRPSKKYPEVWRRRKCHTCDAVWTTREYIDLSTSHRVRTRHKHLQAFSRDKLFLSVKNALQHRKTALDDAIALTDTIVAKVMKHSKDPVVEITQIVEITSTVLRHFDKTAAAVYDAKH